MDTIIEFEVVKRTYYENRKGQPSGYVIGIMAKEGSYSFTLEHISNMHSISLVMPKEQGDKYPVGTIMKLVVDNDPQIPLQAAE